MSDHMSAEEYRKQFVDPVLENEPMDDDQFKKAMDKNHLKAAHNAASKVYPTPTEHQIQNAILDRLGFLLNAFFWRENSGLMRVSSQGKERFFRAGTPGIPDIMGVYRGHAIGIEVKRPGKKQSPDQRAFQERFDKCGGIYIVCSDAALVVGQINAAIEFAEGR